MCRCQAQPELAHLRAEAPVRLCSCTGEQLSGGFFALPVGASKSL